MMQTYNVILRGLYPELTPREINHISLVIVTKLRKIQDTLSNVELYNQQFVSCGSNQELTSVEVFNRKVHIRLSFK